ncbi:MAG TPA: trehalase family glycosidase [Verrucomicrobiae bacterium]|nr:trehalase family glycosidase [Verrucomicrobiae bacterium]
MITDELREQVKLLYAKNRRQVKGHLYTVPSEDTYPYQWLWDSCFHAVTLSYFDSQAAKAELRSLVSAQFSNGMIPHMIYWQPVKKSFFPEISWGKRRTSSITQPPLIAAAVDKINAREPDLEFVKEMVPRIDKFHRYLFRHRDPRHTHLIGVINPDESGEDNSPRFDMALGFTNPKHQFVDNFSSRLKLVHDWRDARFVVKQRMDVRHWVRDVPINSILCESLAITARLADLVQEYEIADWSYQKHLAMKQAMREKFYHDGLFLSTMGYGDALKVIPAKTWGIFMPLYAGLLSAAEAMTLVDSMLLNPETFKTPYSVPTVAKNEPSFDPSGDWRGDWWTGTNWRGPVWMASNWLIIKGLRQYGFLEEADRIAKDSLALLKKSGFREYYDPLTGEGHGAAGFTWGGLVLDMWQ